MVRFSKFTPEKKIYDKIEGFLSKLVWRETLFNMVCDSFDLVRALDFYHNISTHQLNLVLDREKIMF